MFHSSKILSLSKLYAIIISMMIGCGTLMSQSVIFPQQKQAGIARAKHVKKEKLYVLSNDLLTTSFINKNKSLIFGGSPELGLLAGTELFIVTLADTTKKLPASEMKMTSCRLEDLQADSTSAVGSEKLAGKSLKATFRLGDELEFEWQAILRDGSHYLRTSLTITSLKSTEMSAIIPMIYDVKIAGAPKIVGNTRGSVLASETIFAGLETPTGINTVDISADNPEICTLNGLWSRHATLEQGKSWNVSTIVGLIAPGQARRSFLAYNERERAVPWRAFPIYNSWYELNIDRNNAPDYANHMTSDECVAVINKWNERLHKDHNSNIQAFVWDDGWDNYGTWTFNPKFPNGFSEPDSAARESGAGIGAWLGPVGGYGQSGEMRRGYWADKGGMQLSNPLYYKTFLDACQMMINDYDFRFFKLDGISAQFSSTGPDAGHIGEENAEGIINILREVRKMRPDMFFNTTVGTWASPFWFHFSDAVWRQEADWSTIGDQGDDRERWITYRDRLVHQNFVENSPLCPINTLMTHGMILTKKGDVSKSMDYDGIVRELRCAFACGSGMVELYCDAELLDSINGGALWKDIADCIEWQKANADVLPDTHWVGGNPWDGKEANIYGWAAWNGKRATLSLRNPSTTEKDFIFTLRHALEIPDYVTTPIVWQSSFSDQPSLKGFNTQGPIDLDTPITVTLPGSSVYIFNGSHSSD